MKFSLIPLSVVILTILDYTLASICNSDNVGQRIGLPTSCSKFLVCSRNRRVIVRECPKGLHFNRELEMCDLPSRSNCRYGAASLLAAVGQCETCDCNVCCKPTEPTPPEVTTPCEPETPKPTTTQKPETTTTCEPETPKPTTTQKPETTTPCEPETPKPTTTQKPETTTPCEPETPKPTTTQKPETTTPVELETPKPTTTQKPEITTTCEPETTTPVELETPKPTTTQKPETTTTCEPETSKPTTTQKPETTTPCEPETPKPTTTQKPETTTPCEPETPKPTTTKKPEITTTSEPETTTPVELETPKPTTTQKPEIPTTSEPETTTPVELETQKPTTPSNPETTKPTNRPTPETTTVIPPPSTPNECNGKPNGQKLPGNTCQDFIVCQDNQVITLQCPNNLHFNAATGDCDFPENAKCDKPYTPPHAGPSGTTCANGGRCVGKPDGTYFADAKNKCSANYVICQCECEVERFCSGPLIFNDKLGVCDWPSAIGC